VHIPYYIYTHPCLCVHVGQHSQVVRASACLSKSPRLDFQCSHFGDVFLLEKKALLTLLQSAQLYKWGLGDLGSTSSSPSCVTSMGTGNNWGSKYHVSHRAEGPGRTMPSLLRHRRPPVGYYSCADLSSAQVSQCYSVTI